MGIGAFSRPPWFHSPEKKYGVSLSAPPIPTALRKLVREQFEDSRNILETLPNEVVQHQPINGNKFSQSLYHHYLQQNDNNDTNICRAMITNIIKVMESNSYQVM